MRRKKLLLTVITLFTLSLSLFAAGPIYFSHGDYDSLYVYDPFGARVDALTMMSRDGYIIQTGEWESEFTSDSFSMTVYPNSLLAVVGYSDPALYLLDGGVLVQSGESGLTVYTTTAKYTLPADTSAEVIYTAEEDSITNLSGNEIAIYDALRNRKSSISAYTAVDMLTMGYDPVMYAQRVEKEYMKTVSFKGTEVVLNADREGITMTYSGTVRRSLITDFFTILDTEIRDQFTYRISDESVYLRFSKPLSEAEYTAVTDEVASRLLTYIISLYRPSAPKIGDVSSKVNEKVPSVPVITQVRTRVAAPIPEAPRFTLKTTVKLLNVASTPEQITAITK
ncbi:MAG: hypothetical protein SPK48_04420 [Bullifex sp.]|nr:hypothetical protein [Spirochaetales bacterium]MDY5777073.1 hypothetical protein [Bullifex sp.]